MNENKQEKTHWKFDIRKILIYRNHNENEKKFKTHNAPLY